MIIQIWRISIQKRGLRLYRNPLYYFEQLVVLSEIDLARLIAGFVNVDSGGKISSG